MSPKRARPRIELIPDLSHCIETVARGRYDDSLGQYFRSRGRDPELEESIELLRLFLESANFAELRRDSERHLTAGHVVKFILYLEEGGAKHEMEVIPSE